jgi:hypothetical protein
MLAEPRCRELRYDFQLGRFFKQMRGARHNLQTLFAVQQKVNRPEAVRPSGERNQARNLKPQAPSRARPRA